jgi:hypothetical protein
LRHSTSKRFWQSFALLSEPVQRVARENYELLKANPQHPSLHLKRVGRFWAVRVGLSHRALGVDASDGIVWFWIGKHDEYDRLVG